MFDLKGRVAVVTGGNGGIGLGMARGLVSAGAQLAVVGRNEEKSKAAVKDLEQRGGQAFALTVDVTDEAAVGRMVDAIVQRCGRLDILINNAGTNIRKPPHELTLAEWHLVLDTNLDERLSVLPGGLSRDEAQGRRQDHQHRLDDVDLRRFLRSGVRRQQGRYCAADEGVRRGVGP